MNNEEVMSITVGEDTPSKFDPSPQNDVALTIPAEAYIEIAVPTFTSSPELLPI